MSDNDLGREPAPAHQPATPAPAPELELAREQALVRTGWELVQLLGTLDVGQSRKLLSARWDAERARAAATLTPLVTGPEVGPRELRAYEGPAVQARFRRTLDYLQPGERVFEIGPGRGYLAGLLLRDGGAAAYYGVDLHEGNLRATRELLARNGLADRGHVTTCNLYDLTRDQLIDAGADLLVCCEVIEHVPDPERALRTLAGALPTGAGLLISVPLLGRLEGVWGHLALFDAARTEAMVADAGLVVHAVDVVDNMWVFVLASHGPGPSARAARAARAAAAVAPPAAGADAGRDTPTGVRTIELGAPGIGPSGQLRRLAHHQVDQGSDGLRCELTARRRAVARSGGYGGVRIPVTSPRGLRLELSVDALDDLTAFYVDAYAGRGRVARWVWDPAVSRPSRMPATFVLRPGRRGHFRATDLGELASADAVDLVAAVRRGSSVSFRVSRAAVIV